jgi:cytochrome c553
MRRTPKIMIAVVLLACVVAWATGAKNARARSEYRYGFAAAYLQDNPNQEFVETATKTKCYVCHDSNRRNEEGKIDADGKKSKKRINSYGKALSELLTKKDFEVYKKARGAVDDSSTRKAMKVKMIATAKSAIEKLGKTKSPSGITYDEFFKQGKLPSQPTE